MIGQSGQLSPARAPAVHICQHAWLLEQLLLKVTTVCRSQRGQERKRREHLNFVLGGNVEACVHASSEHPKMLHKGQAMRRPPLLNQEGEPRKKPDEAAVKVGAPSAHRHFSEDHKANMAQLLVARHLVMFC